MRSPLERAAWGRSLEGVNVDRPMTCSLSTQLRQSLCNSRPLPPHDRPRRHVQRGDYGKSVTPPPASRLQPDTTPRQRTLTLTTIKGGGLGGRRPLLARLSIAVPVSAPCWSCAVLLHPGMLKLTFDLGATNPSGPQPASHVHLSIVSQSLQDFADSLCFPEKQAPPPR